MLGGRAVAARMEPSACTDKGRIVGMSRIPLGTPRMGRPYLARGQGVAKATHAAPGYVSSGNHRPGRATEALPQNVASHSHCARSVPPMYSIEPALYVIIDKRHAFFVLNTRCTRKLTNDCGMECASCGSRVTVTLPGLRTCGGMATQGCVRGFASALTLG